MPRDKSCCTSTTGPGALADSDKATYLNHSDDGKSYINGTMTLDNQGITDKGRHMTTDLEMTGAHTGSLKSDLTYGPLSNSSLAGSVTVIFDGKTLKGPPKVDACGDLHKDLARATPLKAVARRSGADVTVKVTAAVAAAGANERTSGSCSGRSARASTASWSRAATRA
jgi:hypothetical protein